MAAPSVIQQGIAVEDVATPHSFVITGVTAGSTIILGGFNPGNDDRIYTISDDKGNTWTQRQRATASKLAAIWSAHSVASGDTTITIESNFALAEDFFYYVEISESTYDTGGSFARATNSTSHFSAESGGINTATDVYVFCACCHNAPGGTITPGAGFTKLYEDPGDEGIFQALSSASALTGNRGDWTSTTSRNCFGAIASFAATGGDPPGEGSGNVSAIGSLSGVGQSDRNGSGSIAAIGSITGVGFSVANGSGSILAIGLIEGVGIAPAVGEQSGFGSITAIGEIDGVGSTTKRGSGSVDTIGVLDGVGFAPVVGGAGGFGSVIGIASITGSGQTTHSGSGSFNAIGSAIGAGQRQSAGSANINAVALIAGVGRSTDGSLILQFYYNLAT